MASCQAPGPPKEGLQHGKNRAEIDVRYAWLHLDRVAACEVVVSQLGYVGDRQVKITLFIPLLSTKLLP